RHCPGSLAPIEVVEAQRCQVALGPFQRTDDYGGEGCALRCGESRHFAAEDFATSVVRVVRADERVTTVERRQVLALYGGDQMKAGVPCPLWSNCHAEGKAPVFVGRRRCRVFYTQRHAAVHPCRAGVSLLL